MSLPRPQGRICEVEIPELDLPTGTRPSAQRPGRVAAGYRLAPEPAWGASRRPRLVGASAKAMCPRAARTQCKRPVCQPLQPGPLGAERTTVGPVPTLRMASTSTGSESSLATTLADSVAAHARCAADREQPVRPHFRDHVARRIVRLCPEGTPWRLPPARSDVARARRPLVRLARRECRSWTAA